MHRRARSLLFRKRRGVLLGQAARPVMEHSFTRVAVVRLAGSKEPSSPRRSPRCSTSRVEADATQQNNTADGGYAPCACPRVRLPIIDAPRRAAASVAPACPARRSSRANAAGSFRSAASAPSGTSSINCTMDGRVAYQVRELRCCAAFFSNYRHSLKLVLDWTSSVTSAVTMGTLSVQTRSAGAGSQRPLWLMSTYQCTW